MNVEFVEALNELCKTRRIKKEVLLEAIEQALMSAYKKNFDSASNARVNLDAITGEVAVYAQKKVVEQVENPQLEISVDSPAVGSKYQLGDIVEVEVTPRNFGRIAAQAAKQVIVQRIREAERGVIYDEYIEKEAEILTAIVLRCIYVGVKSGSYMNRLICIGIAATFMFQIIVNTGMCMGVFPVIGLTLPFISYGGSSLVTTFAAVGIVSGIRMRPAPDSSARYIRPAYTL